jgi:DNA damage-inducible protein 1
MADLTIGNSHFVSSFTVMQQTEAGKHDLDFLLGLDNLKRHQSVLDLKEGVLRIGQEVAPFLAERDIPGHEESLRGLATSVDGADPLRSSSTGAPSPGPAASVAPPVSAPAPAAARGPANNSAAEQKIQSVVAVTGATRQQAVDALRQCNGNADAAVQMLNGFF